MENFKKIIAVIIASLFFPIAAAAATVGFVPSTGVWFSPTTFSPGETVTVNTVVVNDDYQSLSGQVIFSDNGQVIGTATIQALGQGKAEELNVLWQPSAGQHAVSARLSGMSAINEAGQTEAIDLSAINSQSGQPLVVAQGGTVAPTTPASDSAVATVSTTPPGATVVSVTSQSGELTITPAPVPVAPAPSNAATQVAAPLDSLFAKNRAALDKAAGAVNTITTTAAKINTAYTTAQKVIAQGQSVYNQTRSIINKTEIWFSRFDPVWQQVKQLWNLITDNNEPRRTAIVVGIIVLIILVLWWRMSRGRNQEY